MVFFFIAVKYIHANIQGMQRGFQKKGYDSYEDVIWIFLCSCVVVYFLKTRREPSANEWLIGFQPGAFGNSTLYPWPSQQRTTKERTGGSSARQKGGSQHQHAHAAAKNTNPHKASSVPASHGEKVTDPCGWSERYQFTNTGKPPGYYPLGTTKKTVVKKTCGSRKTLPWSMRWKLAWWWRWDQVRLKTASGSPKNSFNLARFAIGYYINYSWR